ncbi:hypothetical protein PIB30_057348 [Stylosanthes scabra]|uniref:Uncharacterized protein n=1 Tax=Stylosanthes scabra TaxID=79078 RepID=A0ABU6VJ88_9FABA|nr:hypothetical protein [Stylosanthes scabra]
MSGLRCLPKSRLCESVSLACAFETCGMPLLCAFECLMACLRVLDTLDMFENERRILRENISDGNNNFLDELELVAQGNSKNNLQLLLLALAESTTTIPTRFFFNNKLALSKLLAVALTILLSFVFVGFIR